MDEKEYANVFAIPANYTDSSKLMGGMLDLPGDMQIIRGYGGGAIAATQDLSDFFGLEDGKYGRAILNNSKTKIVLNLEPDEAQHVQEVLKLSRTEIRSITQFERGEALIASNNNKVPVIVKVSKAESAMITTDRSELAELLREMSKEKTRLNNYNTTLNN